MTPYLLASITGGVVMGLWFERLVDRARSLVLLGFGVVALTACLLYGQEWAGIALGSLLGARTLAGRASLG
jgi:hypothetical protein